MPKNRLLYIGIIVVVSTALVWLGTQLLKPVEWLLPYTGIIGVLFLIAGMVQVIMEKRKTKN